MRETCHAGECVWTEMAKDGEGNGGDCNNGGVVGGEHRKVQQSSGDDDIDILNETVKWVEVV